MEDQLGATLVVRSSRKLRLTAEGEALMPFALRLEELCRDVRRQFGRDDEPRSGSIRIGAIETFAASHLVGLIAGFTESHPTVDVSVETGIDQRFVGENLALGARCGVCLTAGE